MVRYSCAFYRTRAVLDETTMRRAMDALHDLRMGFFPAGLWVSKEKKVVLENPSAYTRALIPKEYYIKPGIATLPLEAANAASFVFTESDQLDTMPSSLVIQMTDAVIASNGWKLEQLLRLFRSIGLALAPDYGHLCDDAHSARSEYLERMFAFDGRRVPTGLFWINYFGPGWVNNIGAGRIDRLKSSVASMERLDNGGVIIAIQEVPYDEAQPEHRKHQQRLEELMELPRVQAAFPNPGL
jgi:hypothetical protein